MNPVVIIMANRIKKANITSLFPKYANDHNILHIRLNPNNNSKICLLDELGNMSVFANAIAIKIYNMVQTMGNT